MAEQIALPQGDSGALEHPAVRAWSRLNDRPLAVGEISIVKHRPKSTIYRIEKLGSAGSPIIAKHCRRRVAAHERIVYEEVLPGIPISCPHYYGFVQGESYDWLFLEYVEGELYNWRRHDHIVLAAKWLALLHSIGRHAPAAGHFQEIGSAYYLGHLRGARARLCNYLGQVHPAPEDLGVIKAAVRQCDFLESRWDRIEQWCGRMPRTLVHADFKPKNVVIRAVGVRSELVAFDWEASGWGIPAEDLSYIDLAAYNAVVSDHWPGLNLQDLQFMKIVGMILRGLAELYWESFKLDPQWKVSTAKINRYRTRMAEAVEMTKWGA